MKFVRSARPVNLAGTANQKVVVSAVFVAAAFMNGSGDRTRLNAHLSFLAAAALMVLAVLSSLFVNDADTAPTMAATAREDFAAQLRKAA